MIKGAKYRDHSVSVVRLSVNFSETVLVGLQEEVPNVRVCSFQADPPVSIRNEAT